MAAGALAAAAVLAFLLRKAYAERDLERAGQASLKPYADRLDALRTFLSTVSGEAFLQLDSAMRLNGANTTGEQLLGLRGVQLTGRPLASFLEPGCPTLAAITEAVTAGKELKRVRARCLPRKGFDAGEVEITTRHAPLDGRDEWWVHVKLLGGGGHQA